MRVCERTIKNSGTTVYKVIVLRKVLRKLCPRLANEQEQAPTNADRHKRVPTNADEPEETFLPHSRMSVDVRVRSGWFEKCVNAT